MEVINDKFTKYANHFRGGDMLNNRYILLSNIVDGMEKGDVRSESKELNTKKAEIATLIANLFFN